MKDNFLQVAGEHARRYPLMEPQDFGKLAYQSEFGPEHLISDKQQAESFLMDEWKTLPKGSSPQFSEPVSESLCRFPLSICTSMDEIGLLVKLFIHTAEEHKGNVDGAISGFLYNRSKWQCIVSLYRSLIIAMIGGRVIWGIVRVLMLGMILFPRLWWL